MKANQGDIVEVNFYLPGKRFEPHLLHNGKFVVFFAFLNYLIFIFHVYT